MAATTQHHAPVQAVFVERIGASAARLRELPIPISRSCHVGNLGTYNYGLLRYLGNARLNMIDHSLYQVDRDFFLWIRLDSRGRVAQYFDHRGREVPRYAGRHVHSYLADFDRRRRSILNYSIDTRPYHGFDHVRDTFADIDSVSRKMNGRAAVTRCIEFCGEFPLLNQVIRRAAQDRRLDLLFDRWCRTNRQGNVVMSPVDDITYRGADAVRLASAHHGVFFEGDVDELTARLRQGVRAVRERLEHGTSPGELDYPWFTTGFGNYASISVLEHVRARPGAFYHAGATLTPYYVRDAPFAVPFTRLIEYLIGAGWLPHDYLLTILPTYCFQLFATGPSSAAQLDALLDYWRGLCRRPELRGVLGSLSGRTVPHGIGIDALASLDRREVAELSRQVGRFNEIDPNVLPIDFAMTEQSNLGLPQRQLRDQSLYFPPTLDELTWAQAETLVRLLTEICGPGGARPAVPATRRSDG